MTSAASPDGITAESLVRTLTDLRPWRCPSCQAPLCHHQTLMSVYLGFRDAPRCLPCLAASLGIPTADLRDRLIHAIHQRDCYRAAWDWASQEEGLAPDRSPACLMNPAASSTPAASPNERGFEP